MMATSPVEKSQLSLNDGAEYPEACAMGIGKEAPGWVPCFWVWRGSRNAA